MVEYHPHLASRFPGSRSKRVTGQGMTALTPFEREFIHAIHSRQIFPVFQPIVDERLRLQGIEILSRWRKDGVVLPPGEFLPHIHSEYAWLLLTAFVLQVVAHWNETLLALTLIQSTEKYTLPVALISFVQQQTYSGADWGGLFAGLCIVVLPMLIIYVWLGRRLTEGLTLGMGK